MVWWAMLAPSASDMFGTMNVPDDLRYSADHEWARIEGTRIRIGITDYAQDSLGDVVFVQIPETGVRVAAGGSFSEVRLPSSLIMKVCPSFDRHQLRNSFAALGFFAVFGMPVA